MTSQEQPRLMSTVNSQATDALRTALRDVRNATTASHGSILRYDADRSRLHIVALSGIPFLSSETHLTAIRPAESPRARDDRHLIAPAIHALTATAGVEEALAVPLRHRGEVRALLCLGWAAGPSAQVERMTLGVLGRHVSMVERTLFGTAALPTRVVVAHEDPLVADGIARRLERRLGAAVDTCSELGDVQVALQDGPAEVVLCSDSLDAGTPVTEIAAVIRDERPHARVVVLTRTATALSISAAQSAHADGLVGLDDGAPQLLAVVAAVGRGDSALPPKPAAPDRGLSRRELQLLRGLDEGLTYHEIATRLGVSLATVKTQSRSLFRKLEVTSRGTAVHRGRLEGLL